MKRGSIWTIAGGSQYAGKPRPAVIVQDEAFSATSSVTVCPFTSDPTDAPLFRIVIEPTSENGLRHSSRLMIDKLTTVSRDRLGVRIGKLGTPELTKLNAAIVIFLGLASPMKRKR